ncbi:MAG TPA: zf-HC2 domain-containing protein [Actinomycetospora sp.]|uniref:zf-HC2 domain-containing protein n=1 Tax=Actinomycetospora sp. TaxID=1872135 RepID=UPI002F40D2D4
MNRDPARRLVGIAGNPHAAPDDLPVMGPLNCAGCREELSAELDGEGDPARRPAVRAHLDACADCTRWREQAAVVTRLTRTGPAEAGPDLVARVLPAAPPRSRRRVGARAALAAVGVAQLVLGVSELVGLTGHGDATAMLGGADMAHMGHETAAWNLALGVAFLAGARWTRHLAGLLPVLGVFIVTLAVLSGLDLAAGRVEPDRVASHAVLLVGFALAVAVARSGPRHDPGPAPRTGETAEEVGGAARSTTGAAPLAVASRDDLGPVARERPPGRGRRDVA